MLLAIFAAKVIGMLGIVRLNPLTNVDLEESQHGLPRCLLMREAFSGGVRWFHRMHYAREYIAKT